MMYSIHASELAQGQSLFPPIYLGGDWPGLSVYHSPGVHDVMPLLLQEVNRGTTIINV